MGEGSLGVIYNATSNIDVIGSTFGVGGISGNAHYGNTIENCSSSGNVTLQYAQDAGDQYTIGGIAGLWVNNEAGAVTFRNCSFTGTLTTGRLGVDYSAEVQETNVIVGAKYTNSTEGELIIE